MKLVYRIVAECSPEPDEDYMQLHGDELDDVLENALADFLLEAGSSFIIHGVYVDRAP